MTVSYLHTISCLLLAGVALYSQFLEAKRHYVLHLPFIIGVSSLGLVIAYRPLMELFVAHFSGAKYEFEDGSDSINPKMLKAYLSLSVLRYSLPVLLFIPALGRTSWIVLVTAIISVLPLNFICGK